METILTILGTAGFSAFVSRIMYNNKTKAETAKILAETYGSMLDDLRTQLKFQGEKINQQAFQIINMQERETQLMKMIGQHHEEKKALIDKHTLIETELRGQIKALETKLADRINKIEDKFQ